MIFRQVFFVAFILFAFLAQANKHPSLKKADSLFVAKRYTEAFANYDSLYVQGQASPAMLIKMAFIKEGLGDFTHALLYLDSYYKHTSDKKAIAKMHELAAKNDLIGYEYSDYTYMINTVNKYGLPIFLSFVALSLLTLICIFVKKPKSGSAAGWITLQVLLLIPIGLVSNNVFDTKEAIINTNQTLVMSGPSAAADPVQLLTKGNKVQIVKDGDVWTKIKWGDKYAYVRSGRLLRLF